MDSYNNMKGGDADVDSPEGYISTYLPDGKDAPYKKGAKAEKL